MQMGHGNWRVLVRPPISHEGHRRVPEEPARSIRGRRVPGPWTPRPTIDSRGLRRANNRGMETGLTSSDRIGGDVRIRWLSQVETNRKGCRASHRGGARWSRRACGGMWRQKFAEASWALTSQPSCLRLSDDKAFIPTTRPTAPPNFTFLDQYIARVLIPRSIAHTLWTLSKTLRIAIAAARCLSCLSIPADPRPRSVALAFAPLPN
ncbi:hypothetical protein BS50DRAFT_96380 [Corynespora cassiicola Philippines]|uniref:Uncharacterized protein n=1 Tax=Corynespora cassiicola Philippines TaxID=1448308 RepID=A0A2T2NF31_CORCC|nr:hypothetical protein BS50DRAFT_96380 [Corynespora cassiicola Philippines]